MTFSPFKRFTVFFCLLLAASLSLTCTATPAYAADGAAKPQPDVLLFLNGDRLAGKLDHVADGKVYFKSENLGKVQVSWAKLKELRTGTPFAVIETGALVGRKKANFDVPIGTIAIDGATLTVTTKQGTQHMPVKNIAYLVDQRSFEKNVLYGQHFWQGIAGSIGAGVSTVYSTQNSVSINTAVALARAVPPIIWMPARQRTLLNFTSNYGKVTQPNTPTVKTNILHGALEEDEYFSPRFYLLQQATFDHNFSQGLDLQQLYGIGVGYTAIKNPKQGLDLTAIVAYTKQQFSGLALAPSTSTDLIGSSFGDNYVYKFPRKILFTQVAAFNPAWNSLADYSANVTANVTFPVFKNFGFTAGVVDSYLNDPPKGFQGNSVQFNTGLTYTLP